MVTVVVVDEDSFYLMCMFLQPCVAGSSKRASEGRPADAYVKTTRIYSMIEVLLLRDVCCSLVTVDAHLHINCRACTKLEQGHI
eukprot:7640-Heterococcus_DN1.PRE.3